MRIVLIIIGAIAGIFWATKIIHKRPETHETVVKKSPEVGCFFYLLFVVIGGLIGWIIYSIFA